MVRASLRVAIYGLNPVASAVQDLWAGMVVFVRCIANFESAFACCSAVLATCVYNLVDFGEQVRQYPLLTTRDSRSCRVQYFAAKLSWTFAALAVVFPLTHEIKQAFVRREQALDTFAKGKAVHWH